MFLVILIANDVMITSNSHLLLKSLTNGKRTRETRGIFIVNVIKRCWFMGNIINLDWPVLCDLSESNYQPKLIINPVKILIYYAVNM